MALLGVQTHVEKKLDALDDFLGRKSVEWTKREMLSPCCWGRSDPC